MFTALLAVKKSFNSYLRYREVQTDNVVFRLHCVLTAAILLSASIILTTTQLTGSPINCLLGTNDKDKYQKAVNTFCWVMSTFTLAKDPEKKIQSQNSKQHEAPDLFRQFSYGAGRAISPTIAPGVGPGDGEETHYTYYQWVCFVLFFQAILCYLPKALWNVVEGGLLARLATGLHGYCTFEEREKKINAIVMYLKQYRKTHKTYTLIYWGCELLCLLNLIVQMWFMNSFLGGEFFKYGVKVLARSNMDQYDREDDAMIRIFPRLTKCIFLTYGPSGSIQTLDNLCILPQNQINEKTYIFLWFWYIFLVVLFSLLLGYRLMLICLPGYRPQVLGARSRLARSPDLFNVSRQLDLGDWWLLYMLAKNVNPIIYKELINSFAKSVDEKKRLYPDYKYTTLNSMDLTSLKNTPYPVLDPPYHSSTKVPHQKSAINPTAPLPSPPIEAMSNYKGIDTVDSKEGIYSHVNPSITSLSGNDLSGIDFSNPEDYEKPKKRFVNFNADHSDSGKGTLEKQ